MASASSEGGPCDILVSPASGRGCLELPGPGRAQQLAWMSWHCSPCTMPVSRGILHPTPLPSHQIFLQHQPLHWATNSCQILTFISYPHLFYCLLTTYEGDAIPYYSHFQLQKLDAQRDKAAWPKSHCSSELRLESCSSGFWNLGSSHSPPRDFFLAPAGSPAPADHPRPCSVPLVSLSFVTSAFLQGQAGGPSVMAY